MWRCLFYHTSTFFIQVISFYFQKLSSKHYFILKSCLSDFIFIKYLHDDKLLSTFVTVQIAQKCLTGSFG